MTSKRRVVITGMGCVSPLGLDVASLWDAFVTGRSGIGPITRFDASDFATRIAGEVRDFDPLNWVKKRETRQMDRFILFAVAAADEAVRDSGLEIDDELAPRVGTIVGVGLGGLESIENTYRIYERKGPRRISPYFIPMLISNLAPGQISMRHNTKGPSITATSACASGSHGIGDAMRWIQHGEVDAMITGGAEATVTPLGIGGFNALKAISTRNDEPEKASRPFDRDRDGFVVSEGAGILIMEELEHAKKRGAKIYAELTGYAATADANHITQPAPGAEGAVRSMRYCLENAGLNTTDIDYINAHGTSTPVNDPQETAAIKAVFGDHAYKLSISSTKSMTGHLLGAAGAVEAIAACKALVEQVAPPTINLDNPDEECDLDYIPHEPRSMKIRHALSNSLGFGGTNATLIFSRYDG
ncbi:MAG: beta-ketoacyl-ACP synthase II [Polyangia bacterium]